MGRLIGLVGILLLSGTLLLLPLTVGAQQKESKITVTGTVVEKGTAESLVGVTVVLKGTATASVTDTKGNYSITIPAGDRTLVFSFMGFKTQEIAVGKRRKIDVMLEDEEKALDEVVVIGYGTTRKRDITGAIVSVQAEKIMEKAPVSIFDALQGEVAGVEVVTGSGAPGDEAEVKIRGASTFEGGSKPLYVVDGVPTDEIGSINAADIESIEVLKDAASAAIYGSRSANGVILVTTKKGDATNPRFTISYLRSYSQYSRKMPSTNAAERKLYDRERRRLSDGAYGYQIVDTLASFMNSDTDLQDLIFRTAVRNQLDLSASGGSSSFKYYASFGYLSDKGIIVGTDYNRFTARVNAEYKASKVVTVGSNINLSYSNNNGISEDGVLNQMLQRPPYWAVINPDGSYVPNLNDRRNPYAVAMTDVMKKQNYRASVYQYVILNIGKHIKANISLQGNYMNIREQYYRPTPQLGRTERATGRDYTLMIYDYASENYVSYSNKFGGKHELNVMVGNTILEQGRENIRLVGYDYTTDELYTLNAASDMDNRLTYTKLAKNSLASIFGRASYNYKSRYLLNFNLRYDGSSRFGSDRRWGMFPSASAGWRFSDEKFLKWTKPFVNDAKLRLSWGITGNQEIGNYDSWQLYSPDYIYNGKAGIAASNLAYDDLGWEKTTQYNAGLDLSLLGGKLQIVFDAYQKNTNSLLATVQYPKETGFATIRKNVGAMTNQGVELSVNYRVTRTKDFSLTLNGNIASNRSKIKTLADGTPFYRGTDDAIYVREGGLLGDFYGYRYLGIFPYDESNAFADDGRQLTPVIVDGAFWGKYLLDFKEYTGPVNRKIAADGNPLKGGDVNFADTNGDWMIDSRDKQKIGNAQPKFFGGFGLTSRYKRFTLNLSFSYSVGGDIYNYAEANRNRGAWDGTTPSPDYIHDMWTRPGDNARYPIPIPVENNRLGPSDFYVTDGSYLKLRSARLTYLLPEKLLRKVFIKRASIYVYGNHLLTFTRYKGYDPEFSTRSSSETVNIDATARDTRSTDPLNFGIDQNRYPRKREGGIGVNVTF
ncbi:MAG: TonB-dependent receptor [Mediterranea sp.]|jgi:TonB-linked SusC/RagA family outer membrane protein|nr:TonB-dependent receptor [Mediterranea sp.]